MAAVVARTEQPLLQAVFDLESPQLVFGRVVVLGDAAFVARQHVVAGVTKAALDAQCLADSLAAAGNDLERALAHYDAERRQFGRSLVARARHLGLKPIKRTTSKSAAKGTSLATPYLSCATMVPRRYSVTMLGHRRTHNSARPAN